MGKARTTLRRWHIRLGWIVALPLLVWTATGLVMVARPIEEVRGEHLIDDQPRLPNGLVPKAPVIGPRAIEQLVLEQRSDGPRWIVRYADGGSRLADAATGRLLPSLTAPDAARLVLDRYAGEAQVKSVDRIRSDDPPLDLRRSLDAWRVTMTDGTRFYLDAATGEIVARRTAFWRLYDLMWGLHIMDLRTREKAHNPLVIGFGAIALVSLLMAILLLPRSLRGSGSR